MELFKEQVELLKEKFGQESIADMDWTIDDIEQFLSACQKEWVGETKEKVEKLPRNIHESNHFGTSNIITKYVKLDDVLKLLEEYE